MHLDHLDPNNLQAANFETKDGYTNKNRNKVRAKKFEEQEKISYQELLKYVHKMHPTKVTG